MFARRRTALLAAEMRLRAETAERWRRYQAAGLTAREVVIAEAERLGATGLIPDSWKVPDGKDDAVTQISGGGEWEWLRAGSWLVTSERAACVVTRRGWFRWDLHIRGTGQPARTVHGGRCRAERAARRMLTRYETQHAKDQL